ncbi:MAG: DNA methyltransferase [bacterium]
MMEQSLFVEAVLRSQLWDEFQQFSSSTDAITLRDRLQAWADRDKRNEKQTETAFIQRFFVETWGYQLQGALQGSSTYTCLPQFSIEGAGQRGNTGISDVALGCFGVNVTHKQIPQVLCEFKDIRSGLDDPQPRKGNPRSPVQQCLDYLTCSWQSRGSALVEPTWAIVTDMNEFRLYTRLPGHADQYQRFVIEGGTSARDPGLLANNEIAAFRRFLFWRLFRPDFLLAERGLSSLAGVLLSQPTREREIERNFYKDYRAYREFLFDTICAANPGFTGTRGKLVRLTQRLLDRFLFILFCEDMGRVLSYPPELVRQILCEHSVSAFYSPEDTGPWDAIRRLFRAMCTGGQFGSHTIGYFNGGLFEPNDELESLIIPAKVFCAKDQATDLPGNPLTLLYFSSAYNFGLSSDSGERTIGLTTLGRIFEQSITELEIMEAKADNRESINILTKRKTDGVYYTPEWVTRYIVEQTIGARLADIRAELGEASLPPLTDEDIARYHVFVSDKYKRRTAPVGGAHAEFWRQYRERLGHLRIVDPACGSGAFLIQALDYLIEEYERIIVAQHRLGGRSDLFQDQDSLIRSILTHNIYGVDINSESVEITKLALWLHTATPGKPLCALDRNIRCGNSLVGTDFAAFYRERHETLFEQADVNERERINAFDWPSNFVEVFSHGGFDCVIGNPPYVKLQHFRRYQPDVADYLTSANRADGTPVYESTRTGNFDMYLPFIEKGIELLCPEGRMGYIAPNVWMVNEYGQALRAKIKRNQSLDRWLDFKSFQVFDEAITYTALQFFTGKPSAVVRCAFAPDGEISTVDWSMPNATIRYNELPLSNAWNLVSESERNLINRLNTQCTSLEQSCKGITVGIQTSENSIYHLRKKSSGKYESISDDQTIWSLEDELMHPLAKGPDVKRYILPVTDLYILVPYEIVLGKVTLITEEILASKYPLIFTYLNTKEQKLRLRENGKMDKDGWWGYNYPKNIEKQSVPRLLVAGTAPELRFVADPAGAFTQDDRRVFSVIPNGENSLYFLLGILNSPLANYVFKKIARPKANDFFDIEKQFIAPLPIPDATPEEREQVAQAAEQLQEMYTRRRDLVSAFEQRLMSAQTVVMSPAPGPDWLWAEVGTVASWKVHLEATRRTGRELTAWAKARYELALEERIAVLDGCLTKGTRFDVRVTTDQLILSIGNTEVLKLFDKPDAALIAAQWRHALRDANVTEAFDGRRLLRMLLDLRATTDASLHARMISLDDEITVLDQALAVTEQSLNTLIYRLYRLTPAEISMIDADRR